MSNPFTNNYGGLNDLGAVTVGLSMFAGFVLLISTTVYGLTNWSASLDTQSCEAFGQASGRDVQFVRYHHWNWDCLTMGADGKLISVTLLRDELEGK